MQIKCVFVFLERRPEMLCSDRIQLHIQNIKMCQAHAVAQAIHKHTLIHRISAFCK